MTVVKLPSILGSLVSPFLVKTLVWKKKINLIFIIVNLFELCTSIFCHLKHTCICLLWCPFFSRTVKPLVFESKNSVVCNLSIMCKKKSCICCLWIRMSDIYCILSPIFNNQQDYSIVIMSLRHHFQSQALPMLLSDGTFVDNQWQNN